MKDRNLFKGKIKGEKTGHEELDWAIGNLVKELSTGRCFIIDLSHFTDETKLKDVMIEVEPKTICRRVGINDKNGKLIWENDILRGHGNPKDLAKAVHGEFIVINAETLEKVDTVIGWHTEVIPTDAISKCEPFCLSMPLTDFYIGRSEFEVIGNIFDNPELLEELEWIKPV